MSSLLAKLWIWCDPDPTFLGTIGSSSNIGSGTDLKDLQPPTYSLLIQRNFLQCIERSLLPYAKISSTTHVQLLQWLRG